MAEAKHEPKDAQQQAETPNLNVRFLSDEEAVIELNKPPSEINKIKIDPFVRTEKIQFKDYSFDELFAAWQNGEISNEDARAQMRDMYRLNHSTGSSILDDDRKTTETRISEYVTFAMANGQTLQEAETYAIGYLMRKGSERGTLAGNWGTVNTKRDIRKKKRR